MRQHNDAIDERKDGWMDGTAHLVVQVEQLWVLAIGAEHDAIVGA